MLIDSRTVERDSVVEADLAIVGSGPAGISIAKEFHVTGFSDAMIERGGPEYEQEVQDLYNGEETGELKKEGKSCLLASCHKPAGLYPRQWDPYPGRPQGHAGRGL